MPSCIIKGCFNTWKQKDSNVILHVFPKEKECIRSWLIQSPENFPNVEELVEKIHSQNKYGTVRLCSKHFNDDQYFHEGTKRRLRPKAVPTIFIAAEKLPSEKVVRKRRRKTGADGDLSMPGESIEGASSNVIFYPQTSDPNNSFPQQVLPSHLKIVIPSTSLLGMGKPKMYEKAINTDMYYSRKCQAVGTDPMFGKRNFAVQTMPWKGKSQGTLCSILLTNYSKFKPGMTQPQHRVWQGGLDNVGNASYRESPRMLLGQAANNALPKQIGTKSDHTHHTASSSFAKSDHEAFDRNIKVERMSPTSNDCGHSPKPIHDGPRLTPELNQNLTTLVVKKEETDHSENESSTDDSEEDEKSTKNSPDKSQGHCSDPENDANFTVLKSCLYDLIKLVRCQYGGTCHSPLTNVQVKTLGSVIAIDVLCCKGHNSTLWHSQPGQKSMAGGDPLTPGGEPSQMESSDIKTYIHNLEYSDDAPM
ncbi:hypothetical protein GDO81_008781 [Engystomops pustulosus]|uniref:THAP-type domain-containing protein n=1 Tax=Engystomops pustulosus TaxID=76066 RepID=A0AAV7CHR1_ENGPU|nr:hypothetical protein GDO81_008781 [Engystomops pustulosus]